MRRRLAVYTRACPASCTPSLMPVPDHPACPPSGLPSNGFHEILNEAVQVRSFYSAPHRRRRVRSLIERSSEPQGAVGLDPRGQETPKPRPPYREPGRSGLLQDGRSNRSRTLDKGAPVLQRQARPTKVLTDRSNRAHHGAMKKDNQDKFQPLLVDATIATGHAEELRAHAED